MDQKPKILIVDDDPAIADVIRRTIAWEGQYEPIVAHDGVEGLELYEAEHPVCIIIDAKMPNMDGFQLLRALRGDMASANTALIMVTALVRPNERMTGLLSGADIYLTKPFDVEDLLRAIELAQRVTPEERMSRLQAALESM
jgi:DNA-binding response OmpR family regulator